MTGRKIASRILVIAGAVVFFTVTIGMILYYNNIYVMFLSFIIPGMGSRSIIPWPDNYLFHLVYLMLLFFALTLLGLALLHCIPAVARMKKEAAGKLDLFLLVLWTLSSCASRECYLFFRMDSLEMIQWIIYSRWGILLMGTLAGGAWLLISWLRGRKKALAEDEN